MMAPTLLIDAGSAFDAIAGWTIGLRILFLSNGQCRWIAWTDIAYPARG